MRWAARRLPIFCSRAEPSFCCGVFRFLKNEALKKYLHIDLYVQHFITPEFRNGEVKFKAWTLDGIGLMG